MRHRLAAYAVQNKDLPALGSLDECRHGPLATPEVDQYRLRCNIVVPQIMVDSLKSPAHITGSGIQCNHRAGVLLVERTAQSTVIVRTRGVPRRDVNQPELVIRAHRSPGVGRRRRVLFAGGWLRMPIRPTNVEGPDEGACSSVICADD